MEYLTFLKRYGNLSGFLLFTLFFNLGCATAPVTEQQLIQQRITEKSSAFESSNQGVQNLILQGKIAKGMTEDQVYIALGDCDHQQEARINGKKLTAWVYSSLYGIPYSFDSIETDAKGNAYTTRAEGTDYYTKASLMVYFDQAKTVVGALKISHD